VVDFFVRDIDVYTKKSGFLYQVGCERKHYTKQGVFLIPDTEDFRMKNVKQVLFLIADAPMRGISYFIKLPLNGGRIF
jgi:hypothetical protein